MPLPNTKEHDHAKDEREDAHQVHTPHNLGVHKWLARETSIPLLLVMMVERGAKENALAGACRFFRDFEPSNLH